MSRLALTAPSASPQEAAAVIAALERFMRATARPASVRVPDEEPWQRAALLEGVERETPGELHDPWIVG